MYYINWLFFLICKRSKTTSIRSDKHKLKKKLCYKMKHTIQIVNYRLNYGIFDVQYQTKSATYLPNCIRWYIGDCIFYDLANRFAPCCKRILGVWIKSSIIQSHIIKHYWKMYSIKPTNPDIVSHTQKVITLQTSWSLSVILSFAMISWYILW